MLRAIDSFLNGITMYRLVLYGLAGIGIVAFLFTLIGVLDFSPLGMLVSLAVLMASCLVTNYVFAKAFRVPANVESAPITALILFLIVVPVASVEDAIVIALTGALAMTSKYLLAINKRHLFNPVAIALVIVGLAGSGIAFWWVAAPVLLPFVLVLGLLIVRKIRRFDLLIAFVLSALIVAALYGILQDADIAMRMRDILLSWPLVFLGTVMLTEPLTMPPSRRTRVIYGVIVGALFSSQFHIGPLFASPELALVIGNVFAYLVGSKQKLVLGFREKVRLAHGTYEFVFRPDRKLAFAAGQYLEWTLPPERADSRGNRRYFTVASAPGDDEVRLGVRILEKSSSFKKELLALEPGAVIHAGSLAGDFVLPADTRTPLVFIAGGIGITPFASMLRDLLARGEQRSMTLIYAVASADDVAYRELIDEAQARFGMRVELVVGKDLPQELLNEHAAVGGAGAPDAHSARTSRHRFYISGPNAMVHAYRSALRGLGVPNARIRTDYFPGL